MTLKKQMLNVFIIIAEATFSISLPLSFEQVILSENHSFLEVPQENFNFQLNPQLPSSNTIIMCTMLIHKICVH